MTTTTRLARFATLNKILARLNKTLNVFITLLFLWSLIQFQPFFHYICIYSSICTMYVQEIHESIDCTLLKAKNKCE